MITAAEAKELTNETLKSQVDVLTKDIEKAIREAISGGYTYCYYDQPISHAVVEILENMGYKVDKYADTICTYYQISWNIK